MKTKRKFTVLVSRISYSNRNIEVEATSKKEAKEKALDAAIGEEFREHDVDYTVDAIKEQK